MPKFCANLSMLYNEVDFLDRFGAAAKSGFKGVEYLFPYAYPAAELRARLDRHQLAQVLHNLPAGDWAKGERGIACHPDRVGEFQDGVGKAIEYATALGCKQVNCLAGIAPPGVAEEKLRATFVANLRFAAPKLAAAGIRLLMEPINIRDIPGFYLTRTKQAVGRDRRGRLAPTSSCSTTSITCRSWRATSRAACRRTSRASPISSSRTTPAGTSRGPARSTTRSCSTGSTASATRAGSGASTNPTTTTVEGLGWLKGRL